MPQTTKTSTSNTKRSSGVQKSPLDDELGINEPYLNSDPTVAFLRYKGKFYKFDTEGNAYRVYPPDMKP